jgi:hypothetical protein
MGRGGWRQLPKCPAFGLFQEQTQVVLTPGSLTSKDCDEVSR